MSATNGERSMGDARALFDPARHEPLRTQAWDPQRARAAIAWIAADARRAMTPQGDWPAHPLDLGPGDNAAQPFTDLYGGTAGVVWALRDLAAGGWMAVDLVPAIDFDALRERNRAWLRSRGGDGFTSYLSGDLPIDLMAHAIRPDAALERALADSLERSIGHPALELMWGSPGSLLAASFLHQRTGQGCWADLLRKIVADLEARLRWSDEHQCHYWQQELYGRRSSYIDAVHGFAGTAHALIRGRHLLDDAPWRVWQQRIAQTVRRTATWADALVNWRPELLDTRAPKMLVQHCHGAPGFVVCLANFPGDELDDLLLAAGETVWAAGPLAKGANLCHGTAGNGYALLALYQRTGDAAWLARARAFAMHAIDQAEAHAARYGRLRHSLWTGDEGLALFLADCLRERAAFPTLDRFYPA